MVIAEAAIEMIRRHAEAGQPFLAVVWFGSPHQPHRVTEADREQYAVQSEKLQHFYGEITAMDRAVGRLRGELRTLGIADNTILWYCSDNGGLPEIGVTGGRGYKGMLSEGGLRVPAILEWPARVPHPRTTDVPCNTSDLYPTLLEIAGVHLKEQPPLDGISLTGLINGVMTTRPKPMGFWIYPAPGIPVRSDQLMFELLKAQQAADEVGDDSRLYAQAGSLTRQYPEDSLPGHSAWLDWPWKLHRLQNKDGVVRVGVYNLGVDPGEKRDLLRKQSSRVESMRAELEAWQKSVIRSPNGADYE